MRTYAVTLLFAVALIIPMTASAQSHGGIVGGVGTSGFAAEDGDVQDRTASNFAYSVGLQGRVEFQEFLSLKPELLFARRTTDVEGGAIGFDFDNKYYLSYIEIPVLVRVAVPIADILAPKIYAGPHLDVFLDGRWEGETSGPFLDSSDSRDLDSGDVRNLQFGVTLGAGLDINLDPTVVTTSVRYGRNFTPIFQDPDRNERVYHDVWLAMAGFMF